MSDYLYKAEYAKSNRAGCKGCRTNIGKDSLRLAVMVQSPMFDGKVPNWFHYACFWKKSKATKHTDIHGFDSLRWEDQEKIKEKLGGGGGGGATGSNTIDGTGDHSDYLTEYAKSNRSSCHGCAQKIEKDTVRIAYVDNESESMQLYGKPAQRWYHVDCFVDNRDDLEFGNDMQPKSIPGFNGLSKEDQKMIEQKLGKGKAIKKRKGVDPNVGGKKPKGETAEEIALREQSKKLWQFRDLLQKEVSNEALKCLLEYNDQEIPSGESKVLERLSDCMVFGALGPCTECGGQLAYGSVGYRCTGNVTAWTKCMNITQNPKRKAFKVPEEYHDVEFLKNYKYEPGERLFNKEVVSAMNADADTNTTPLHGMKFVIAGRLSKSKAEVSKAIQDMGGNVVAQVDNKVAAVVSSEKEVNKMSKHIKEAQKSDVHVVNEQFVDEVKKGGAAILIKSHSIASWGSDPHNRIGDVVDGPSKPMKSATKSMKTAIRAREENMYTRSVPSTMKMTVKGGAAVDPDSGLEESAHVLTEKGSLCTAVLGLVDIQRGTNSFYKVQILESDKHNTWWVFRAWGRVGTTIGGNKLEKFKSKSSALNEFYRVYGEKTGNDWNDRDNFVKYPQKFYPLDIDYGADDADIKKLDLSAGSKCTLGPEVQSLIKMIFDVESMKKAMLEFEIDMKKMPLGKLSKKQIQSAYSVLNELQEMMDTGATVTKLVDATNRFYTLIPHDFGLKKPPILDKSDIIKAKTEMLDNLLEIEVAYSMLKTGNEGGKDPIDTHYEQLKTDMQVLDKKSEEFQRLVKYVKNTHAATHNQYELEVIDIIKIDRDGEYKKYKPFRELGNRQLLWHGSRTTNYAGILSQGLRIAPPEAPVTGYMFGKGIYFADMVSKSANYCRTTKSDPLGLMLLCEVALGNMYELTGAEYVTKLPKGKHSTKGCGMNEPDSKDDVTTEDGCLIPMGKGAQSKTTRTSLLYNEYIVYDVSQVSMKYLLKVDFKFKW